MPLNPVVNVSNNAAQKLYCDHLTVQHSNSILKPDSLSADYINSGNVVLYGVGMVSLHFLKPSWWQWPFKICVSISTRLPSLLSLLLSGMVLNRMCVEKKLGKLANSGLPSTRRMASKLACVFVVMVVWPGLAIGSNGSVADAAAVI